MESRLVLDSAGIPARTFHQDGHWQIAVRAEDYDRVVAELQAYRQEEMADRSPSLGRIPLFSGSLLGLLGYSLGIVSVFILADVSAYGIDWSAVGEMRAGDVVAGQWWRTLTALTLHVDGVHLGSNLVFGCVFGLLAGRILGGGVAWLTIVVAGALGNLINAFVRDADHVSIGASTAVFAALGIMVAHALRPRTLLREKAMKRWSPLVGGVLMLAMLGTGGERTDVMAHVSGFVAGVMIGWIGCRLPDRYLARDDVQFAAGFAAFGIIAVAWIFAVIAVG
ncbi:Rhomboid family protein [Novipirellula artificiosorum]|uniref:Rhomboid family protein n=2 Tax=Novipirellula artificiosorum TaxID=2528016 RepID=A0A5C6DZL6_9BACT|nr:Rhomboid family protein [Novipirellula artificiosorum]